MPRVFLVMFLWLMACAGSIAQSDIAPIPESEQAVSALKIIDAYHTSRPKSPPKKLHIVYFTPSDREPAANYETRLDAIIEDIRSFYLDGMERTGFGPKTFPLDRDASGKLIIHLVKSKEPAAAFPRWEGRNGGNTGAPAGGDKVLSECRPALKAAGISVERETVLIFCHLATYDKTAGTFRHHSPYYGNWTQQSGLCFAADWAEQNLDNLSRKEPRLNDGEYGDMSLGRHATIFIGGVAHELGHAFALPHCARRADEKALGTSIMGSGNHTYREERRGEGKGSFLTMASAMRLASHPVFNGSDKGLGEKSQLQQCDLILSTNTVSADLAGRRGTLRLEGTVKGTPAIYGVVAYFDSVHDGGYRAPTATSVPDSKGRFAIEISDLAKCESGELRIEFCHANGAVSARRLNFAVNQNGGVDISEWEMRRALQPVAKAIGSKQISEARAALRELEKNSTAEKTKTVARKLVATLEKENKLSPATVPSEISGFFLGDTQPQEAKVGWLTPTANRLPPTREIESPLLDSGKVYATGLFAHAPSRYIFDLGGKWKKLRGEAGLHTDFQNRAYGVVFIIKADGKEMFRSNPVRGTENPKYNIDLANVNTLELLVEKASEQNGGNWALWLDPELSR